MPHNMTEKCVRVYMFCLDMFELVTKLRLMEQDITDFYGQ